MVAGAVRVRRTGHALSRSNAMWGMDTLVGDGPGLAGASATLGVEMDALGAWFGALGRALEARTAPPAAQAGDPGRPERVLGWMHAAAGRRDASVAARALAWGGEHLETLRRHEPRPAAAARRLGRSAAR